MIKAVSILVLRPLRLLRWVKTRLKKATKQTDAACHAVEVGPVALTQRSGGGVDT